MYRDHNENIEKRGAGTKLFIVENPFEAALGRIRRTLGDDQLCIAAEIDARQRVKQALDISVPACRVLLVDNPAFMLEITSVNRAVGIFIPLHLIVSAAGDRTFVKFLDLEHPPYDGLPMGIKGPLVDLHRQIVGALGRIAHCMAGIDG
jgi:uncharacterized protein (DUF302 family)